MSTSQTPILTAPLAGVSSGLQAQGVYGGRRQLFIRFAGEAETATMYRADALAREVTRLIGRTAYHSIAISGRDALGCSDFLAASLAQVTNTPPIMLDTIGDRPAALGQISQFLKLVQVTLEPPVDDASRALETLRVASDAGLETALSLIVREELAGSGDAAVVRIVEQARAASPKVSVVIHPGPTSGERVTLDRRWSALAEQLNAVHADVRMALRLPGPAALR